MRLQSEQQIVEHQHWKAPVTAVWFSLLCLRISICWTSSRLLHKTAFSLLPSFGKKMAHACSGSYLGAEMFGRITVPGHPSPGKKVHETSSQWKNAEYSDTHLSSLDRLDQSSGMPGQKVGPYLKNNQNKKGWRCGSSGRMPSKHEVLSSNHRK
jgi:hypothetical protein